jgi:mRNA interferase RelE/StbE
VPYRVEDTAAARRDLQALPRDMLIRVEARIQGLADDPRPPGVQRLRGSQLWRLRVGDYRLIFAIDDAQQLVTIARVRHRGDVYRGL